MRTPSFKSSPRIRSAPQSRLSVAMRWMRATTSGATRGSRGPCWRDARRQNTRNPSLCHRRTVSGLTRSRAWRHPRYRLASSTSRPRSWTRKAGRLTAREATMSCCRRSAFSAMSSARERVRSAMNPLATPEGRHAWRSALIARAARSLRSRWRTSLDDRPRIGSDRAVLRVPVSRLAARVADLAGEEGSSQHSAFRENRATSRTWPLTG